jgi:hypothetical protein
MSIVKLGQTSKQTEGKSRVITNTYWEEIAEVEIPDHELIRVVGSHVAIGTTELILSEESTGQQFYLGAEDEIVATSTSNEDATGGDGALTIEVGGLIDTAGVWSFDTDIITMAGTPGTGTTTKKFIRMFYGKTLTAGATGSNEGTITFTDQGATGTFMKMTPGHNKTKAAVYTVPSTKKLLIRDFWTTAAATKAIESHLYVRPFGGVFAMEYEFSLQNSTFDLNILLNSIAAKSDVEVRVETTTGSAGAAKGGWVGRIENA